MGIVYKAEDTKLKRTVALKFLPQQWTSDTAARERFIHEAQAASALDHPHICNIHEIEETADGQLYIAMAFYEGESLRERIRREPLNAKEAVDIAIQVAQGMAKAHEKGIVHRDIKPANILMTKDGTAKIVDFGLAKLAGQVQLTRAGTTIGTAAYMSPEQARGKAVDRRTDIWSLGVVLYEMLAGQLPFKGDLEQTLIHSILKSEPEPITKFRKDLPKGLEQIILKSLLKSPSSRYQTMDEFLADLNAVAEGLKPLGARPALFRGRILGIKKTYAYSGLAAAVILGAFFLRFFPAQRAVVYDSLAVLPFVNVSENPSHESWADSMTDLLIDKFNKVAALSTIPWSSVRYYKNSKIPPKDIAKELRVRGLVEGTVLKIDHKIRLTARLIDPYLNKIIWAPPQPFEGEDSDQFYLQADLAQAIVNGIRVRVTPEEKARLAIAHKVMPEAAALYSHCMNIVYFEQKTMSQNRINMIGCLEKVIDIDPGFARAHAELGQIYLDQGGSCEMPEKEVYPKAESAIRKALELDDNLGRAHAALAWIKVTKNWDFPGAEREFERAMNLDPGDWMIKWLYMRYLGDLVERRFDEALAIGRKGLDSPLRNWPWAIGIVNILIKAERYDEAIEMANKSRGGKADRVFDILLAQAYALKGLFPIALSYIEKTTAEPGWQDDIWSAIDLPWILALSGRRREALEKAEELRDRLVKKKIDAAYWMACVYAGLGDKDQTLKLLNEAYDHHSGWLFSLKVDYHFINLRNDPRFKDLLRKVGFEQSPETLDRQTSSGTSAPELW